MNKILQLLFFCSELVLVLIIYAIAIVNAKSTCQDVIQYELSTTSSLSKLEFKHSWIFWQAQNKGKVFVHVWLLSLKFLATNTFNFSEDKSPILELNSETEIYLTQLIVANSSVTTFQLQYFDNQIQEFRDYRKQNGLSKQFRFYNDKYYVRSFNLDIITKVSQNKLPISHSPNSNQFS